MRYWSLRHVATHELDRDGPIAPAASRQAPRTPRRCTGSRVERTGARWGESHTRQVVRVTGSSAEQRPLVPRSTLAWSSRTRSPMLARFSPAEPELRAVASRLGTFRTSYHRLALRRCAAQPTDELDHPFDENTARESLGPQSQGGRVPRARRQLVDRVPQRLECWLPDEDPVDVSSHDVSSSAAVERNHWCSGGHRFDHRDAKVLFRDVDETRPRSRTGRRAPHAIPSP